MSKHPKPTRSGNPPTPPAGQRGMPRATFIALAVVVVAGLGYWSWKSKHNDIPSAAAPPAEASATNPAPAVAAAKPDFQKLKGKWLRPDGGYVVEVRSVTDTGAMDAAYFNPKPIHVAKAEASLDGAAIKVFIELRDVNYPGSTYTLAYDPATDQLQGIYFQALQQQRFEVVFVRMK